MLGDADGSGAGRQRAGTESSSVGGIHDNRPPRVSCEYHKVGYMSILVELHYYVPTSLGWWQITL